MRGKAATLKHRGARHGRLSSDPVPWHSEEVPQPSAVPQSPAAFHPPAVQQPLGMPGGMGPQVEGHQRCTEGSWGRCSLWRTLPSPH